MGGAYNVLSRGTPEQIERYLLPTLRGERSDAYAVTEGNAGSDAGGIEGSAERSADGFRLRAEKWFVTTGDKADYFIVMVNVVEEDAACPPCSWSTATFRASSSSTTRRSPTTTPTAIRRSASTCSCR